MTLKKPKDAISNESYPMARGATFEYANGGRSVSHIQGRQINSIKRCMFIQGFVILLLVCYFVLLTVWLYPRFPMFEDSSEISTLNKEIAALKVTAVELSRVYNETKNTANVNEKTDESNFLHNVNKEQKLTTSQINNSVEYLQVALAHVNKTLHLHILNARNDFNDKKEFRKILEHQMASLSKRFADINYRVERACELSKNGIKNLTNRMNEQETIFFDAFGEIHNRTVKMDHDVEVRLNATKEWLRGILNKMNIWSNLKLNQLNKTMNERKNILEKFRASYAQTAGQLKAIQEEIKITKKCCGSSNNADVPYYTDEEDAY